MDPGISYELTPVGVLSYFEKQCFLTFDLWAVSCRWLGGGDYHMWPSVTNLCTETHPRLCLSAGVGVTNTTITLDKTVISTLHERTGWIKYSCVKCVILTSCPARSRTPVNPLKAIKDGWHETESGWPPAGWPQYCTYKKIVFISYLGKWTCDIYTTVVTHKLKHSKHFTALI